MEPANTRVPAEPAAAPWSGLTAPDTAAGGSDSTPREPHHEEQHDHHRPFSDSRVNNHVDDDDDDDDEGSKPPALNIEVNVSNGGGGAGDGRNPAPATTEWTPNATPSAAAAASAPTMLPAVDVIIGAPGAPHGGDDDGTVSHTSSGAPPPQGRDAVSAAVFRARRAPPTGKSLFLTELHEDTEFGDLNVLFGRFGGLVSCRVLRDAKTGKSRRLGYVNFESNEAAREALDGTNGKPGPHGAVMVATFADNDPSFVPAPPKRLFVRFIPLERTEADVRAAFAKYGEITAVEVARDTCRAAKKEPLPWQMGYVTFDRTEDATKALAECDRSFILGDLHHVVVKVAEDPSTKAKRQQWREQAHAAVACAAAPTSAAAAGGQQGSPQQQQQQGSRAGHRGEVASSFPSPGQQQQQAQRATFSGRRDAAGPVSSSVSPTNGGSRGFFGTAAAHTAHQQHALQPEPPSPQSTQFFRMAPPKPPTPTSWSTPVNTPSAAHTQAQMASQMAAFAARPDHATGFAQQAPPFNGGAFHPQQQSSQPATPGSATNAGCGNVSPGNRHAHSDPFQQPLQQHVHVMQAQGSHHVPPHHHHHHQQRQHHHQQQQHQHHQQHQPQGFYAMPPQPQAHTQHGFAVPQSGAPSPPMYVAGPGQGSNAQPSSVFGSQANVPVNNHAGQSSDWARPQVQVVPRGALNSHMPYPQFTNPPPAAPQHHHHHHQHPVVMMGGAQGPFSSASQVQQQQQQQQQSAAAATAATTTGSASGNSTPGIALTALPSFGGGGGGGGGLAEPADNSGMFSQFVSSLQANTVNMSAQAAGRASAPGHAAASIGAGETQGSSLFGPAVPPMHSAGGGGGGEYSQSAEHSGQSQPLLSPSAPGAADASPAAPQLYVRTSDGTFVPVAPS